MKPLVYIVTLNWNGLEETLECLNSLRKVNYPNFKVVVVDNGSENNEADKIEEVHPEVKVIKEDENHGHGEGNNIGTRYALSKGADFVMLLNNDTTVTPDFISILVEYLQKHNDVGIVGSKILYDGTDKIWFNGGKLYWWIGFCRHLERLKENSKSEITSPLEVDYITSCCWVVKKEVYEKVGYFDPEYFIYWDDVDFCFKVRRAGYKSVVVPQAEIYHKVSSALGVQGKQTISPRQAYLYAKNAVFFGRKNLSGFKKYIFLTSQYTVRFAVNLILCSNNKARIRYMEGLLDALKLKTNI